MGDCEKDYRSGNSSEKGVQRKIIESEERYTLALENAEVGLFDWDLVKNEIFWNDVMYRLLGMPVSDGQEGSDTFFEHVHPDDLGRIEKKVRQALKQAQELDEEFRVVRPDSEIRWVKARGSLVIGEDRTPARMIGVLYDITERRKAEQAVERARALARERLREIEDIYHNAPIGLCVMDRELRFVRINEKLAEINGIPAEDHIGKTVRELLPQLADETEQGMRRVLEKGEPELNVEVVGETPAEPGAERSWLEQWLPIRDEKGRVTGLNIVAEETTARKENELNLKHAKDLSNALNRIHESIHKIRDPDTAGRSVLRIGSEALHSDSAALYLRHENGWVMRAAHNLPHTLMGQVVSDAHLSNAVKAVQTGKPAAVSDAFNDEQCNTDYMRNNNVRSVMTVPLFVRDEPLGVIVFNYHSPPLRDFTHAEESFCRQVGSAVSIAFENMRLMQRHKSALRALLENEEWLDMAMDAGRIFAFEWDPETDEVTRSDTCAPILGLDPGICRRSTGEQYFTGIHEQDRDTFRELIRSLTPDSPSYETRYRYVSPDSTVVILHEKGTGEFDTQGNLERVIGVTADITEQSRMERRIEYLSRFPEETPHPVLRVQSDGMLRYANPAAEPVVQAWNVNTGERVPEQWLERVNRALDRGETLIEEAEAGDDIYSFTIAPVQEKGYVNIYGTVITDLKKAHEREKKTGMVAAASRTALDTIEAMHEGVALIDMEGTVRSVNPALAEMTGYEPDRLEGARMADLLPRLLAPEDVKSPVE